MTDPSVEQAIAHVEDQLSVVFGRARTVWKEAALQIHPDLNPAGYKLLATVVRLGSTNAHALAELFDMDKSVVSRQVRMLEEVGLMESRPDPSDGRVRVLVPTSEAVERITAMRARNQSRLHAVLRERSAEELELFAEMLGVLAQA